MRRSVVRITVRNRIGQASFMTLAPSWTSIPSKIRRDLCIQHGQRLSVLDIKMLKPHSRTMFHAENDKVDMLSLIPEQTRRGFPLYVDQHEKGGESWLTVWYPHPRGAARQIELKRYVNASMLGRVLGQLQAEGEKAQLRVAFKNAAISEHADFVAGLLQLGIRSDSISGRCVFNPNKISASQAMEYFDSYRNTTGVTHCTLNAAETMKGMLGADSFVRSAILARILLFAMDEVRSSSTQNDSLRRNFLAKLLSGDGSLDSRKTSKRLDVRVKIVDGNTNYLRDYANILSREGFKPRVHEQKLTVRSYCTWTNLLTLYQIGAFKNSRNWVKLLCSMKIALEGRENQGYGRIQELAKLERITSRDVSSKYGIGERAANLWMANMRRFGLMKRLSGVSDDHYRGYAVTYRGGEISNSLDAMKLDYRRICVETGIDDPEVMLHDIKGKNVTRGRSTEQRSQTC